MKKVYYAIIVGTLFCVVSCHAQKKIHGTYYSESGYVLKITKDSTLMLLVPNSANIGLYDDTLAITRFRKVSNELIELNSVQDAYNKVFFQ